MNHSLQATYYRTALLLGLIKGRVVQQWAEAIIEHDPEPPQALFEVVSVPGAELSALRRALWPMVQEPDPPAVLEAVFGQLHDGLASGSRTMADTLTILRQIRSMVKLPAPMYDGLNGAMVARAEQPGGGAIEEWLKQFAAAKRYAPD